MKGQNFKAVKRKERCRKAINLITLLTIDSEAPELIIALNAMKQYRKKLDQ